MQLLISCLLSKSQSQEGVFPTCNYSLNFVLNIESLRRVQLPTSFSQLKFDAAWCKSVKLSRQDESAKLLLWNICFILAVNKILLFKCVQIWYNIKEVLGEQTIPSVATELFSEVWDFGSGCFCASPAAGTFSVRRRAHIICTIQKHSLNLR